MAYYFLILFALFSSGILFSSAFAHTTVYVEQYEIEAGWRIEPSIVGFRNDFVFAINIPEEIKGVKSGVKNAFKNLDVTVKFGGITKDIDMQSDPTPGHYFAPVIPTSSGSIFILLDGEINGTLIQVEIPIEDVENTAILDFPPRAGSDEDTTGLKNALSAMQKDIISLKSQDDNQNTRISYNIAVFGLFLGAAGVILAIIAMIRK